MSERHTGIYIAKDAVFDLVYGPDQRAAIQRLAQLPDPPRRTPAQVRADPAILRDVQLIFTSWGMTPLDGALLDAAPNLEYVFYAAGTISGFMTDEAYGRGVRVSSAYGANAVPVAEYTVAHVLLALKHCDRFARRTRQGKTFTRDWAPPGAYRRTVGLVSLGMIGRMVCDWLRRCDVDVIAYDPFLGEDDAASLGVTRVSLAEVFSRSHVVSLHTPLLAETRGMVADELLGSMREGASLINTSRGAVVNQDDLVAVAQRRDDLSFYLDVTWPEPPPADSPLYTLENVTLTPHIAGSLGQECHRMSQYMVQELERFVAGRPMKWEITSEQAMNSTHRVGK